jgi:cytochrome P450
MHDMKWARLAAAPLVAPAAVNELLRYDGPVQATGRLALEDFPLANKTIKKGEHVTLQYNPSIGFRGLLGLPVALNG